MTEIKIYLVGGSIRDRLLGLESKDLDYSVDAPSYQAMRDFIIASGGVIVHEVPEFVTIKARLYGQGVCDYVLCRNDGEYFDGRHPDSVEVGTIYDDLQRRDFTMNAIAQDMETGELLDPHGGMKDIRLGIIRCVGRTEDRLSEDSLRLLRAMRFSITKRMLIDSVILPYFDDEDYLENMFTHISPERIYEEVKKMFAHNTLGTLRFLDDHKLLRRYMFLRTGMWLLPTTKQV